MTLSSYSMWLSVLVTLLVAPNYEGVGASFAQQDLSSALNEANRRQMLRMETDAGRRKATLDEDSPEFRHSGFIFGEERRHDSESQLLAHVAQHTLRILADQHELPVSAVRDRLRQLNLTDTVLHQDSCSASVSCQDSKYRTYDGSCNNLENGNWGKAGLTYARMVPSSYTDGIGSVRQSQSGADLPSTRSLTQDALMPGTRGPSERLNMNMMVWGQFISHDIVLTPGTRASDGSAISCCADDGTELPEADRHSECLAISIPAADPFFGPMGRTCMNFVRAQFSADCSTGDRAQLNILSSYIDAGTVYGTSEATANNLRSFVDGKLKVQERVGDNLLPGDRTAAGCPAPAETEEPVCFGAGDVRVNEQPTLAIMHTIWMRQHNKIATELKALNPTWTDENIFQEARRIIAAQHQHITYYEYLPILLGNSLMNKYKLRVRKERTRGGRGKRDVEIDDIERQRGRGRGGRGRGGSGGGRGGNGNGGGRGGRTERYDSSVNPTALNAFGVAAFRYGHSEVSGQIHGYNIHGALTQNTQFSNFSFAPAMLYNSNNFDSMLRGLNNQKKMKADLMFTPELVNRLFAGNRTAGLDLPAINIQRGRDHGVGSYLAYRRACDLSPDLGDIIPENSNRLTATYANMEDIDLYVGGMMERPVARGVVGPTFACIIGETFKRIKFGDRYFYGFSGETGSFSTGQKKELMKTTLARVLCDNSLGVTEVQPNAFRLPRGGNRRRSCADLTRIPTMDLSPWAGEAVP